MARDAEEELEDNPAMGWRALRLALDRDGLMKAQARALLEAAAGKVLHVMFPMVSEPWEYEQARALVEHQSEWLGAHNKTLQVAVCYAAMTEVPALAKVQIGRTSRRDSVFTVVCILGVTGSSNT